MLSNRRSRPCRRVELVGGRGQTARRSYKLRTRSTGGDGMCTDSLHGDCHEKDLEGEEEESMAQSDLK